MTPATPYGEILVTVIAFVGIIWAALVTGLMFAKAARPESSVLFSRNALISDYEGKPTLMFRLGNARGNSVVEATLSASALVDQVSPEGIHMKRLFDLKLVRSRQPLFALSWMVLHIIDEDSPFHGCTEENIHEVLERVIITMVGHDETYANTVHARKTYYADELLFGHAFEDVLYPQDGRLVLDFRKFHEVYPQEKAS